MKSETYANFKRTISSDTTVRDTDSLLNCDTRLQAINITLQPIPANFPTVYRLYVKDIAGYATTNNITITAPTGFLVNGNQSVTINVSFASISIVITSNTDYQCIGSLSPIAALQDFDTGWINLTGFGHMAVPPQYRVIDRLVIFQGYAVVPLSNGVSLIPYVNELSYMNSPFNSPWTGGGSGSCGTYTTPSAPHVVLGFNSAGLDNPASQIVNLPSVINNSNRNPDVGFTFSDIRAWRRVRAQGSTTHGVVYNAPMDLIFQTNGSMFMSLVNNYEDGNWNSPDKTDSRRIQGTNSRAGDYFSVLGALQAGDSNPNTICPIEGVSSPSFKHAISVEIDNANTLGGFQVNLYGKTFTISKSIPLPVIHA